MDDWGECRWTARDLLPPATAPPPEAAAVAWSPAADIGRLVAGEISTDELVGLLRERVRQEGDEVLTRFVGAPRMRRRERRFVAVKSFVAGALACLFLVAGSGYPRSDRPVLADEPAIAPTILPDEARVGPAVRDAQGTGAGRYPPP